MTPTQTDSPLCKNSPASVSSVHMSNPREVLHEKFGFDTFLPGQEQVVDCLMAGHSAAAVFPTGSGKSLCYQLPALLLPGLTLVVSPLIALMKDQIDQLKARGIAAERIDSTLDFSEYRRIMNEVRSGSLRLLYVAPERFNNERFRQAIQRLSVSLFAVDEAHCISEWGHNFRPDYLKLASFAAACGAERILALTATATPQVLEDICRVFQIDAGCAVRTGFYRPNLTLLATAVEPHERDRLLLDRLRERPPGATIVYVTLQRTAEEVASLLTQSGFQAYAYHAGMQAEARSRVQDAFLASDRAVVVATIAFGMGIDKADIRYVYHYNLPKSLENHSQEIGRAGRDGLPSTCEMLASPADCHVLANFAYGDTPALEAVEGLVRELLSSAEEEMELNLYDLAYSHDIRPLVLRTLLTYLEIQGFLAAGTPSWSSYRFRPLATSREILSSFDGERRQFLHRLFRHARKAKTWFDLDLEGTARALKAPRERLVRALDYLGERGFLEVKSAGLRHPYRWLKRPQDPASLAEALYRRTLERERREILRLEQVLELVGQDGCQTSYLSAHFGEPLKEPCGHCSWCLNDHRPVELRAPQPVTVDEALWQEVETLRQEKGEVLASPRAFTRFLTGVTSPLLTRKKLTSHRLFGCLAHVPFDDLLGQVEGS